MGIKGAPSAKLLVGDKPSHLVIFKILAFSDNTNMPFSVLFHVGYNETNYTEIFYKKL